MFYIYVRVSTLKQAEEGATSPEDQEAMLRGLAQLKGVDKFDVQVFSDLGVSGSIPLAFRPNGKKLMAALKPGDTLCAAKLDRLFRSALDALQMAEHFKKNNIALILPEFGSNPINDDGPGKLFFGMLSLVADFERSLINGRMKAGKRIKLERGGHVGGSAPYGFRIDGRLRSAKLEPVAREQELVNLICRLRRRCETPGVITRRVNADGFTTRSGNKFQQVQIERIIAHSYDDWLAKRLSHGHSDVPALLEGQSATATA